MSKILETVEDKKGERIMFRYEPSTKKEQLIYEICRLQPHYTFGDNAEELWNADDEELAELLEEYK